MHTGLEVLLDEGLPEIAGKRIGLVTNHTAVDSRLRSAVDLLHGDDRFDLAALFGPEHGVRGEAQAGVDVGSAVDDYTGLPVHSLYGETRIPTPEMLAGLDALLFDIQDPGVRYATYASTLFNSQRAAASAGLLFVVLDRPNLLTGVAVEGNVLDPAFTSFVGTHPVATRHGMTAGELARLFAADGGWPEPLVVPLRGWRRAWWFDQTGLPWVQPSPNMPTLDCAMLYPGTCLFEGTGLSEGRGTTRPFELIGAPWIDPLALARELEQRNLPGVAFRPTYFTPVFSKHAGVSCGGVQVHVLDRDLMRPVELGVHLLHTVRTLNPAEFAWRQGRDGRYFADLLFGSDRPRRALDEGASVAEVTRGWDEAARGFEERRRPFLLYT